MRLRKVAKVVSIKNKIFAEDCFETMKRFKDNEVSLILTSPPYNTSKHTYTENSRKNHDARYDVYVDTGSHEDYIKWTENLFNEFDRILCENGVVLYNINYGTDGNSCSCDDLIDTIHSISVNTNFMVADIIGWKKSSALPNNTSSNKCTRIFELVFVLCRKSESKTFISNKQVKSVSSRGQNFYTNMFNFIEAPNNDGSCNLNKATYSSDLVFKLLEMYAGQQSGIVYDPFIGTGTTAVGVIQFNRKYNREYTYVGSELSADQVSYAEERIERIS